MIKNILRRIRKFFGLLDLNGKDNPYPLNSSNDIHVNTFSAYPDAYGNFRNDNICSYCGKSTREQMKGCNEITCYRQFENSKSSKESIKKDWKMLCATEDIRWNQNHTGYNFDTGRKMYSFYKNKKLLGSKIVRFSDKEYNNDIIYDFLIEILDKQPKEIIEDQPKKEESINDNNKTHYFHEDNRVFDGGGIISQIDSSWPSNDSTENSSGPYDTDSSSNSNDSNDW